MSVFLNRLTNRIKKRCILFEFDVLLTGTCCETGTNIFIPCNRIVAMTLSSMCTIPSNEYISCEFSFFNKVLQSFVQRKSGIQLFAELTYTLFACQIGNCKRLPFQRHSHFSFKLPSKYATFLHTHTHTHVHARTRNPSPFFHASIKYMQKTPEINSLISANISTFFR